MSTLDLLVITSLDELVLTLQTLFTFLQNKVRDPWWTLSEGTKVVKSIVVDWVTRSLKNKTCPTFGKKSPKQLPSQKVPKYLNLRTT